MRPGARETRRRLQTLRTVTYPCSFTFTLQRIHIISSVCNVKAAIISSPNGLISYLSFISEARVFHLATFVNLVDFILQTSISRPFTHCRPILA